MDNQESDVTIKTDARGEVRRYDYRGSKFALLFTKAGFYRGGDFHPHTQYTFILRGQFEITCRENGQDVTVTKTAGELVTIPPKIPHLYKAITDSVMIEWFDGPLEVKYYEPYRRLVLTQIQKAETS